MRSSRLPTYFSHSYRIEDQELNKIFWSIFEEHGFFFFVDPPSDNTIYAHLERMMNQASCFVAVINRRLEVPHVFCSRFILYELGLSFQARRPRLLLIDERVGKEIFEKIPSNEKHFFVASDPLKNEPELQPKIELLKERATAFTRQAADGRGPLGLLLPEKSRARAYGGLSVQEQIKEAAILSGFHCKEIAVPARHNTEFALALDECDAIILDVRGDTLPDWVFAYAYGRLIPSIKLVHVQINELPNDVPLPPMVEGLRMDDEEPGVESATYWRTPDDLIYQLRQAFQKLDEEPTGLTEQSRGVLYFESIGRRPARIFISNSAAANPLARELSESLRLRSIEFFQYKDDNAIETGTLWPKKIREELAKCQVFVALIGHGYSNSRWCREELRAAHGRRIKENLKIFPYNIDGSDLRFLADFDMEAVQANDLPQDQASAVRRLLEDIDGYLKEGNDGRNWEARQPLLLGASREAVVDALRHLSGRAWDALVERLCNAGISVNVARSRARVQPRHVAEELLLAVQRAEVTPDMALASQAPMGFLADCLVQLSAPERQPVLKRIDQRMRSALKARA